MLDPQYLYNIADGAVQITSQMEGRILSKIVEAVLLRARRGDAYILTARDKWLIDTLQESGMLLNDITKIIAEHTGYAYSEISQAMVAAGVKALAIDEAMYLKAGLEPFADEEYIAQKALKAVRNNQLSISPSANGNGPRGADMGQYSDDDIMNEARKRARRLMREDPYTRRLVERDFKATMGEFRNMTQSVAYAAVNAFTTACDTAYERTARGECGYTQAVAEAAQQIVDQGIVLTNAAGRHDTPEAATLRCVRTGISKMASDITVERATEMGVDTFMVSSHLGARYGDKGHNPSNHWWWQGKVYQWVGLIPENPRNPMLPDFIECTGYGSIEGLCGINCRHSFGPYIEGMTNNAMVYGEEENETRYNLDQKARAKERAIRNTKVRLQGLEAEVNNLPDGPEKDAASLALAEMKSKLSTQNKDYKQFCEDNNLRPLTERLKVAQRERLSNYTMSAPSSPPTDILQLPVRDDPESLQRLTQYAKDELGVNTIYISGVKNDEVLMPMFEKLKEIKDNYGDGFNHISVMPRSLDTLAETTKDKNLIINSLYLGSNEIMSKAIKYFQEVGAIPKGVDAKFVVAHEWGHRISMDEINSGRSLIKIDHGRLAKKGGSLCQFDIENVDEFAANQIAAYVCNMTCKYGQKYVSYLLGGKK